MAAVPQDHKKPADHAAKAEAEALDLSVEHNEVTYVIEREVVNDVEILELIGDMAENSLLLPKVVRTMLGTAQWAKFKDTNRNDAGRVPIERLQELFEALDDAAGKSSASPTS